MDKLKMENFSIPKIKSVRSKDNLRTVELTSRDAIEILNIIDRQAMNQSYKDDWIPCKLSIVDNSTLETEYRTKRKELKELGRNSRELADHYGFLFVKDQFLVSKMVKEGLKSKKAAFNPLGDNEYGVYVCKHPDVQLKIAAGKSDEVAYVLVFKIILGRCKAVQPQANLTGEPAPNYDSCCSSIPSQADDHAGILFPRSQVYLYEYSDDCLPLNRPRHCLPTAVVEYKNTRVKSKISTSSISSNSSVSPSPVTSSRRLTDQGQTFRPGTYGARNLALKRNCLDSFPSSSPPMSAEMGYNMLSNIRSQVQPSSSDNSLQTRTSLQIRPNADFNFPIDRPLQQSWMPNDSIEDNLISSDTSLPNLSYANHPVVMTTPHFSGPQSNFQTAVSANQPHNFYLPTNEIQTDSLQSDNDPSESPMSYYMSPRIADKPLHPFMRKKKKTVTNIIASNITHPAPMRKNNLIIEKLDFPAQQILLSSSSLAAVVTNVTKSVSPNVESIPDTKTDESKKKDMEVMMKTVNKLFGKVPILQEGPEVTTASDQADVEDDSNSISGPHTGYDNSDVQLNAKAAPLIEKTTAESTPNLCVPTTPTKHIPHSPIKLVPTSPIKQTTPTKSVINLDSVISPIKNIDNRELPDASYVHSLAEQLQSLGNIQDVVSKLFTKGLSSNDQQQSLHSSNIFTSTTEMVTYGFQNRDHSITSQNRSYSDTTQNTGYCDTTQNREYYGMTQNREYFDTIHKITQSSVSPRINQSDSFGNYSNSWRSPANRNSHESNDHISSSSQQKMNDGHQRNYNKSLHSWMPQSNKSSSISVNCFGDIDYRQNSEIPQQTDTRDYFHFMNPDVPGFKNSPPALSNPFERRHSLSTIVPSHGDYHCDLKDKITTIRQTSYDSFLSKEDSKVVNDNSFIPELDLSSAKTEWSEIQMHKDLCVKRKMSAENDHNELNLEKQTCALLSDEMINLEFTAKNPSFQPKLILLDLIQIAQTSETSCGKCKSEQDGVTAGISHKKHKSVKEYLEYVGLKIPPKVKIQQRISDANSDSKFATVISPDDQSKQRIFEAETPLVTAVNSDLELSFSDNVFSTTYDERFEENNVKQVKRSSDEAEDKLVMDLEISQLDVKRLRKRYGKEDDKCTMDLEISALDVKKVNKCSGKDDIKLVMDLEISKSNPDDVGNNFNKSICESYVYSQGSTTKQIDKSVLAIKNDVTELNPSNFCSVMDNCSKVALVSSKVNDDNDKSSIVPRWEMNDSKDLQFICSSTVNSDDRSLKVSRWKKNESKDLQSSDFSKLNDGDERSKVSGWEKNARKDLLHGLSSNVDDDSSQVPRWEKNYSRDLLLSGSSNVDYDNNSSKIYRWEKNESSDSSKVNDDGKRSRVSKWEKNYSRDLLPSGSSNVDYDNNSSKIYRWEKNESSDSSKVNDDGKRSRVSKWEKNDSKDVHTSDSLKVDDNSSIVSKWENVCVGSQLSTNNTNNKWVDINLDTRKSTDYTAAEMDIRFSESIADAGNMAVSGEKNTHLVKSISSKNLYESFSTCYSNIEMDTSFGDNISDIGDSTVLAKQVVDLNEKYANKNVDASSTRTTDHNNPVISGPQLTRWSISFQMKNAVDTIRSSNDNIFGTSADDCPTTEVETINQVNQSIAEVKIDSEENSAKQPIPGVEKDSVHHTPDHNTSISYSETDNEKQYVKLDITDDYLKINEEKFPTFPLPNTNNKQESVILEIKVVEGCLERLSKESDYSIMEAFLEVESELIMELKHNKYICRPNQRIPNDILFDYEKNCIYATGDCFVYLTTFLTKQLFMSLLNLKHEILDAYREKQSLLGLSAKQTFLNERLNYFLNKRKLLLRTLTGLVKPSRLIQLERTRNNFLLCMDHMKQTIEQFDSSQMKNMNILFSTLTEHTCIVRSELENIHCGRN